MPYVVGDVNTQPARAGNPLVQGAPIPTASVGVDLKYALRPGPDADRRRSTPTSARSKRIPAVVNLSAFETFFSERRPFFVEGRGIFRFDIDCNDGSCSGLFYSRRIGRAPRGAADVPDGDATASAPTQTTILGAAKLTGRVGAFSVGALNAVTAGRERGRSPTARCARAQTVEPLTNYSVVRARREFANQSSLGFMTTATNRNLDDATRFLPGQAYTGGVDWDWRLAKRYAIQGYLGGQQRARRRRGDRRRCRRAPSTASSAPTPTTLELRSDADVAERLRRRGSALSKIARPAGALQHRTSASRARLRHQRRRLPAPRRPARR